MVAFNFVGIDTSQLLADSQLLKCVFAMLWISGWHICSSCEKAVHYMCYTCTYSLCKMCIKHGKFFSVRGNKGFCDTCFGTILLIESKDEPATKVNQSLF
jgi:hypothetical protein